MSGIGDVLGVLAKSIASVAPTLATMLGGPFAGMAVNAVEGALGLQQGAGAQACVEALQNATLTPDQLSALKQAELKHAEVMGQQGVDLARLNADFVSALSRTDADDRNSARQRQVAVRDKTPAALAWLVIIGSIALAVAVITGNTTKDPAAATQVGIVIGYVFNEAKAVLAYYFGSSAGSDKKTELMMQARAD